MATTAVSLYRGNPLLGVTPTISSITNKALTSNVATITTNATGGANPFAVGSIVTVTGVDSTFDGSFVVCAVGGTTGAYTFNYAKTATNVTSAAVSPNGISYLYGVGATGAAASGKGVSNKVVQNYVATLTTASAHGFVVGDLVAVTIGDTIYDGLQVQVIAVPTTTTFSYSVSTQTAATTAVTSTTAAVGKYPQIYQVASATTAIATNILVSNPTSAPQTFSLVLDQFNTNYQQTLNPNSTAFFDLKQVVAATKNIVGTASHPAVTFNISGVTIA
jgi:hypothetical protein